MSLFAVALWCTAQAAGGDDARARELYENGAILYEEGRYEDAVVAFEQAYRLSGRPALLFNIANALERAGRWSEALDVLSRYRAYAAADERETLDRRITNLERRIAETRSTVRPEPAPDKVRSATPIPSLPTMTSPFLRPLPLTLAGGGVVSLGASALFGGIALGAHDDASTGCARDLGGALRCNETASTALADEAGTALAADVLLGVGVVGLGAGLGLALFGEGGVISLGPGYVLAGGEF